MLIRLWAQIDSKHRIRLLLLTILMVVTSLAEVISIGAVMPFLGALTSSDHHLAKLFLSKAPFLKGYVEPNFALIFFTLIFIASVLLAAILRISLLLFQVRLGFDVGGILSTKIYLRTLYQPYIVHLSRNSSDVIAAIANKANNVVGNILMPFLNILSSSVILVAIISALIIIQPMVALVTIIGFSCIYLIVFFLSSKKLYGESERISSGSSLIIKLLHEGLGSIRDILIDGTQSVYIDEYKKTDLPVRKAQANIQIISGMPRYVVEALGMALIAIVALLFASDHKSTGDIVAILGAFALGAQRILPALQQIYAGISVMKGGQKPLHDVLEMLEQPMLGNMPPEARKGQIVFNKSIELKNVNFRYSDTQPFVLNNINLSIKRGERIGLVGVTGSGKSTLIDILLGLLEPTNGNLFVDDCEINATNLLGWQDHVAHVPQSIFLADASVTENIAFGIKPSNIDADRVCSMARLAKIDSTIESWDDSYQTKIGENGVRLSGGQRQRIGIARGLYKGADFVVFDEATSALDNKTENEVINAIESLGGNITTIYIAHRLTTLKNCDRIIELVNGEIKRICKYDEITPL